MTSTYLYRRAATYWWRRARPLYQRRPCDIRVSLRTSDRKVAQACSALLLVAVQEIDAVFTDGMHESDAPLDTVVLEAIYRRSVNQRAAWIIDRQHQASEPEAHRSSNLAFLDYFQRLSDTNGRPELSVDDVTALQAAGWSEDRIAHLVLIIGCYDPEHPAISMRFVDAELRTAGYYPTRQNRGMVLRTMYKAGREACLQANNSLDEMLRDRLPTNPKWMPTDAMPPPEQAAESGPETHTPSGGEALSRVHTVAPQPSNPLVPTMSLSQAVTGCIVKNSGIGGWSEDTKKQVRKAVELFIFAVGSDIAVEAVTQAHLGKLAELFNRLPNRYGRSREELAGGLAASLLRAEKLPSEEVGIQQVTQNKHFTWVAAVLSFAKSHGHRPAGEIEFGVLRRSSRSVAAKSLKGAANSKRAAWTTVEIATLTSAPPWSGCLSIDDRFIKGSMVIHDGWYWAPLMAILYGGRSSETVALGLAEISEDAPIPFFSIEVTDVRKLKTVQSTRVLPIHPELIRLGFIEYVKAMRELGHQQLFPEYHSLSSKSYASTFYKSTFKEWRDWAFPEGTDWKRQIGGIFKEKDVHSFRKTASNAMIGVPDIVRYYILGHEGTNTTTTVYDDPPPLDQQIAALNKLTEFTAHIRPMPLQLRPIDRQKHGKPAGRKKRVS